METRIDPGKTDDNFSEVPNPIEDNINSIVSFSNVSIRTASFKTDVYLETFILVKIMYYKNVEHCYEPKP